MCSRLLFGKEIIIEVKYEVTCKFQNVSSKMKTKHLTIILLGILFVLWLLAFAAASKLHELLRSSDDDILAVS